MEPGKLWIKDNSNLMSLYLNYKTNVILGQRYFQICGHPGNRRSWCRKTMEDVYSNKGVETQRKKRKVHLAQESSEGHSQLRKWCENLHKAGLQEAKLQEKMGLQYKRDENMMNKLEPILLNIWVLVWNPHTGGHSMGPGYWTQESNLKFKMESSMCKSHVTKRKPRYSWYF